jgi:hypothetical protein
MADRGVAALEHAALPLYRWDIQREIRRRDGVTVLEASLGSTLATDWRACWAGPGLYGLYRHGLLPGVRDIGTAAGVFIHASGRALTIDEIRFILRLVGYRVAASSIPQALARVIDSDLFSWTTGSYIGRAQSETHQRAAARAMSLGRRGPVFREIIARAALQVDAALGERQRLASAGVASPPWTQAERVGTDVRPNHRSR